MPIKVSAIIPAYNEGKTIVEVLQKLKNILRDESKAYEIIVVNDGSNDGTARKARDCGVRVIEHVKNFGYGRSLKDGIRASCGELILLIDADGTYDINEIPNMLRLIENADLVVGNRVFSQRDTNHFKNVTRRFFAYLVSYYTGKKVEDLNSGQRVFKRRDIIDGLDMFPDGFSFSSTITVRYLLKNMKIVYTPVAYGHRHKGSKFISRSHICAITKLALTLTFKGRPFKLSMQLGSILIAAVLLTKATGYILYAGFFIQLLFFAIFYTFLFVLFLCYIYAMGKAIT